MNIFILDAYSDRPYRVSKDTNGGFGTGNDYGSAPFPRFLKWMKKRAVDFPALSIAYLAASIRASGHSVTYGRNTMPPVGTDVVLMPSSIVEHSAELEWAKRVRDAGFKVGFTGPFAIAVADRYLAAADFVITGEPEFLFMSEVNAEDLTGLVSNPNSAGMALDDLPFPDWSVFDQVHLKYGLVKGSGRFFPVVATRGCPHTCRHYCTYPLQQGRAVRERDPEHVVDEMERLRRDYDAGTILFRDPIFSINRKWGLAFGEALARRNLGMDFIVETHLNSLDEELVKSLRRAGLIAVKTGVENADPDLLNGVNRRKIAIDKNQTAINLLSENGIKVLAFYILGLPGDTYESCLATIRYAVSLDTYGAQFSVATPYPGTPWYEEIRDSIITENFDNFTQFSLVWKHPSISVSQMEKLKNIAYTQYYLRPSWMAKMARARLAA